MENFKENGMRIKSKLANLEKNIMDGIKKYNKKTGENIKTKDDYETRDFSYTFEEDYLAISYEIDEGRCGDTYMEEYDYKIPYEFFNYGSKFEKKIDEYAKKRDEIKMKIKKLEKENSELNIELRGHRYSLREAKSINLKYKTYIDTKSIEREIKKCEGLIIYNNEKIKELEGDL